MFWNPPLQHVFRKKKAFIFWDNIHFCAEVEQLNYQHIRINSSE